MKPVVYVSSNRGKFYEDNSFIGRLKDRFKISLLRKTFIKELKLDISNIRLPPNINKDAYSSNLNIAKKIVRRKEICLAPKIYRKLDYDYFNNFQRELMAYGVVKSTKLVLRKNNKSIKDSCIAIYDAADDINFYIASFMAREAKYIVLLSKNIAKINRLGEYIIANFGVSPIITSDYKYVFKNANFIINSKGIDLDTNAYIWSLNDKYFPMNRNGLTITDVTYSVPWDVEGMDMYPEVLGSILCQMSEKNIQKSLRYNGIFLDQIKVGDNILVLD